MKPITLKIPAGKVAVQPFFGFGANYVRYDEGTAKIHLVEPDGNQEAYLKAGEYVKLQPFESLHISHDEASELTIVLYVGRDTEKGSAEIAGSVEVTRVIKRDSANKSHFSGGLEFVGADATHIHLWNPAGSGVLLFVHRLRGATTANGKLELRKYAAALTDDKTNSQTNKYLGQPLGAGQIRKQGESIIISPTLGTYISEYQELLTENNKGFEFVKGEPFVVPEGFGLGVCPIADGLIATAYFEWEEVAA